MARNGREALERYQTEHFDLVLMDVQMPEMDGLAASRAIRALEEQTGTHVPIIAVTSHAMAGDREQCLAAGMDGYISKPIGAATLFAEIEAVNARHASTPSRSAVPSGVVAQRSNSASD